MGPDGRETILLAVGGNATYPPEIRGTAEEQFEVAEKAAAHLTPLLDDRIRLVITHGNGPVVGRILLRMELLRGTLPPMPLDVCVAHSQGGIGYMLLQSLQNRLSALGRPRPVVNLVSRVEVDPADTAFANPTKPIGRFYSAEEASELERECGWVVRQDAGRGYRRMAPSPRPLAVLEEEAVRMLLARGAIVITLGGGGIPVVREGDGRYRGVEAVIDKDRASALLAARLPADRFLILTGVPHVYLNYGRPDQRTLERLTLSQAKRYLAAGHFPPGSMGPKVEAAISYLEAGGREVTIGALDAAEAVLAGEAGTRIVPD